jgi:hypothetical protein
MRNNKVSRFTLEDVDRMEELRDQGASCASIARTYGCTGQYIAHLIDGVAGPRFRIYDQPLSAASVSHRSHYAQR